MSKLKGAKRRVRAEEIYANWDSQVIPRHFLKALQLSDSLFPTGGFSYSDGLETAVSTGLVQNGADLDCWVTHYVRSVFIPAEGLALQRAMAAHACSDWRTLRELDSELTALKPAAATRVASASVGQRFLKSFSSIYAHPDLERFASEIDAGSMRGTLPIVCAVVYSLLGFQVRDALLAFGYTRVAGLVSASLRLAPIGQQECQKILSRALEQLAECVDGVIDAGGGKLTSFSPLLDIQQMNHRYVYSRLFRS
jgi:urease accessory protein